MAGHSEGGGGVVWANDDGAAHCHGAMVKIKRRVVMVSIYLEFLLSYFFNECSQLQCNLNLKLRSYDHNDNCICKWGATFVNTFLTYTFYHLSDPAWRSAVLKEKKDQELPR